MSSKKDKNYGLTFLVYVNFIIWLIPFYYLSQLQLAKADDYRNLISSHFEVNKTIIPPRGKIYVKDKNDNLYLIAYSQKFYDIYFNPKLSKDIKSELNKIYQILDKNTTTFDNYLENKNKSSFVILKEANKKTLDKILSLKLDSIFYEEKYVRIYPEKDFLSTVLGFAKNDNDNLLKGEYGLEKYYDEVLSGEPGLYYGIKKIKTETPGGDLILNIDYFLQKYAEKVLSEGVNKYQAQGGLIIVARPTGEIIALAEEPRYDLNNFNKIKNFDIFLTKASQNYEPGSVMKVVTYFIGLDKKVFRPTDRYFDAGYVTVNKWTVRNFDKKGRGEITLEYALEQSLNTGAIYIQRLIGNYTFLNYLKKFKINQKPYIDLPYLTEGNINNLEKPSRDLREIYFLTASYGHGISLSPFHLIQIFSIFANKGKLYNLSFVDKIKLNNGEEKKIEHKVLDSFGHSDSFNILNDLLEKVTLNGSGKYARTFGYRIGGKTGSAYIPKVNEPGYSDDIINSYVSFFPLSDPKFIILIRIDKPNQGLAMVTTVPLAKKIIDFLIDYYEIQPDNLSDNKNN
jgi:cell division protein FtsI/penicillin-binding protein 2